MEHPTTVVAPLAPGKVGRYGARVADDDLREAERAWLADEADQAALARYLAALRRAGRPVTHDLLAKQVHPPRTFDAPVELTVRALTVDDEWTQVGTTPTADGAGLEIPAHRVWIAEAPPGTDISAIGDALRGQDALGLNLTVTPGPRKLAPLRGLLLEQLSIECRHTLRASALDVVGHLPRLVSLDVGATSFCADSVEPLTRAPNLSQVSLWATRYAPGIAGALAAVPNLRSLELAHHYVREAPGIDAATELRGLEAASLLSDLDLGLSRWSFDDHALEALAGCTSLRSLRVPRADYTSAGLAHLVGLPLESLHINSPAFVTDDPTQILQQLPLRYLHIGHLEDGPVLRLPQQLRGLSVSGAYGPRPDWVSRLEELESLSLWWHERAVLDLEPLGSVPRLRSLLVGVHGRTGPPVRGVCLQTLCACEWLRDLFTVGIEFERSEDGAALVALPLDSLALKQGLLSEDAARRLAESPTLRELSLTRMALEPGATLPLTAIGPLRSLTLEECTGVTREAIERFRSARPDVAVRFDDQDA